MSSTNRGRARRPQDFYETPSWVTAAMLQRIEEHPQMGRAHTWDRVLEPAAGNGAIIRVMREMRRPIRHLTALELNPSRLIRLRQRVVPNRLLNGDFRTFARFEKHRFDSRWTDDGMEPDPENGYSLIFTNPPFSLAEEYVRSALPLLRHDGYLVLLLRLSFLESQERIALHTGYPSDVYVLPRRPSFTGDGNTDSSAYAWFVWGHGCGNYWEILQTPAARLGTASAPPSYARGPELPNWRFVPGPLRIAA